MSGPTHRPAPLPRARRRADPTGARLGERQDRAGRARRGAGRGRRRDRVDRLDREDHRATPGIPVTEVGDLTGYPGVARRARAHPAPARALRACSPTCASRSHEAELAAQGIAPFELLVSNLYPFAADGRVGRGAGCRGRADRHRRSRDGARRREEPRQRRGRRRARRATATSSTRSRTAARPSPSGRALALEAFRHTASYDVAGRLLDGQRARARRRGRPASRSGSARPGRARERAALRRELAPARRALRRARRRGSPRRPSWAARRCRTTTTSTRMPRCAPRTTTSTPTVAIIKHANPCGIATADDDRRGARRSRTPATRSRRTAA